MLGVAVGIMVLVTVLSLTNGFTEGLIRATLRAVPDITLFAYNPAYAPRPENPAVTAEVPFLATKVLLTRRAEPGRSAGVDFATLIGVGPGASGVYPSLRLNGLKPGRLELGSALAASLGAFPGDTLYALSVGQNREPLVVSGSFSTGNYLIDSGFAFATLSNVQSLLAAKGDLTGYQLRIRDPAKAPVIARELTKSGVYRANTWQDMNRSLIQQLRLQKRVIGMVVFLIVLVAALGIANVMVLMVAEKTSDIAILRVLGARTWQVAAVFALEGVLLGTAGVLLGNLLGLALSSYFSLYPLTIPGDLYLLSKLPVEMRLSDFVWVSTVAFATIVLASLLPLGRVLRVKPGLVLR